VLVALCGRETWFFRSREELRPRVFEKWVLRKIIGTKREEVVTGR
jgi:chemotaxis methyl-accepting protein methylase